MRSFPSARGMRRGRCIVAALSAVAAPVAIAAQVMVPPPPTYAGVAERVERTIGREMRVHHLPALSIALIDDRQIVWARGFGLANPADSTPATAETIYRVGSVSKLFTDIAVMQLVEQGKLDLDAAVSSYLPDFHPHNIYGQRITLRELMAHRSGLVREPPLGSYFDSTPPSLAAIVHSLDATTLVYPPGAHTKYSNAALATLGEVLERTQGVPFTRHIADAVLRPLGLTRSGFELTPERSRGLASGYMWTVDGREFPAPTFQVGTAPALGMYSSVTDLARFLSALFAIRDGGSAGLLRPETLAAMWTPQFTRGDVRAGYGLGFHLDTLDGHRMVGHDGAIYGFTTALLALPDEKLGVVVVATLDGASASVSRVAHDALRALLDVRAGIGASLAASTALRADTSGGIRPGRARTLVGRYVAPAGAVREVELLHRGRGLALLPPGGGAMPQLRASGDTLVVDDPVVQGFDRFLPDADSARMLLDVRAVGVDTLFRAPMLAPVPAPARWRGLIGEYGPDYDILYVFERGGRLWAQIDWFFPYPLTEVARDAFAFPPAGLYDGETLIFGRDRGGRATSARLAGVHLPRRNIEPRAGTNQLRIRPLRPIPELRREALTATPPPESGTFRTTDLVELRTLDSTVHLEIRYATTNNFLGAKLYEEPRAFLQRPAALALVRAQQVLRPLGYGLLIHDAYRPWYVTKIFWDATPVEKRWLVADPAHGSRHNRGAAVDLSLYDLATGRPVEMVSTYDESTDRAYADYPGGTSLQRWHRELLRQAMEGEGFQVNPQEWWHFDFADWQSYPILNVPFEQVRRNQE